MLRELFIAIYLFIFKTIFEINKMFPLQKKSVFVASFPGNIPLMIEELNKHAFNEKIIVIHTNQKPVEMIEDDNITHLIYRHPFQFFKSIHHLATARYVFVDNYFAFLAASDFKDEVRCIQVWHAAGALKLFGLNDLTIRHRKASAIKRFKAVYDRFDLIVVGSRKMENIFRESFGIYEDERFLRTGIPRTDFFFDDIKKRQAMQQFHKDFPFIGDKKVLLYAPTYREEQLGRSGITLPLNLADLHNQLGEDYVLLLRLHPALNQQFKNPFPDFVINVSEYDSIETLLVGTDILISDYSSIPFEFALLNKPMIFYVPDFDNYAKTRGIIEDYETVVPGPVVKTTQELIEIIKSEQFDLDAVKQFAREWNEYSNGQSTLNLIQSLYPLPEETREQIRENV